MFQRRYDEALELTRLVTQIDLDPIADAAAETAGGALSLAFRWLEVERLEDTLRGARHGGRSSRLLRCQGIVHLSQTFVTFVTRFPA